MFPSVYRLLAEHGIHNASKITGTGVRGMVTKGDVLAFLGKASGPLGTFKQSPSPIEEALKGLQKKEAPQASIRHCRKPINDANLAFLGCSS
jgi:pyruvate/2-oxoglutarate dehydrogenase complex dihydrolipoamide acyltransferase (E2) component